MQEDYQAILEYLTTILLENVDEAERLAQDRNTGWLDGYQASAKAVEQFFSRRGVDERVSEHVVAFRRARREFASTVKGKTEMSIDRAIDQVRASLTELRNALDTPAST